MANTVAYGFVGLENLFAERVDDSNVSVVRDAIADSVAEHNRQVSGIVGEMVEPTTDYSTRFRVPGSGTLQPLDEYGNPLPVREGGFYDVAFPIQGGGTAWGDNRVTRALMTVDEVNELTLGALRRDADWMKRHILAALLDNVSWTYPDDNHGNLTIQAETDDHYLAQSAAIDDANNPFPAIHTELTEHVANRDASEIVAYVASDQVSAIENLTGFEQVPDPDVEEGLSNDRLVGTTSRGFGDEVLGKVNKVWIIEWGMLPDGYILAVARGAGEPALKMREYPAAELQGLFQEEASPDGNLRENRFIRYAGFGAYNRVAAVVQQIGNATYQIPTGYDAPLAV